MEASSPKTFAKSAFALAAKPPSVSGHDSTDDRAAEAEGGVDTASGALEEADNGSVSKCDIMVGPAIGSVKHTARDVTVNGPRGGGAEAGAGGRATAITGKQRTTKWLPPKWAVNMHPGMQAVTSLSLYLLHMLYLSKSSINFPIQLIPNKYGLTQSIGLDTAAGFAVLGAAGWARLQSGKPLFPPLNSSSVPWSWNRNKLKRRLPPMFMVLLVAYMLSAFGSHLSEHILYILSMAGIDLSVAMHRSMQVLVSHMMWVLMGVRTISYGIKPFFNRKKGSWVGMKWNSNWVWWVTGGYFVSSTLFNVADLANQFVCPLPPNTESVVLKMINPENNDIAAMAVGSIAPCISAPWWEEVLYRGFLLPALTVYLPLKAALPVGSLLFAAHHWNLQTSLPLSLLGLVWSLLFIYSGNLLVTAIVHAMWNSRVFLGALLGL